jgi:hypothetical protein
VPIEFAAGDLFANAALAHHARGRSAMRVAAISDRGAVVIEADGGRRLRSMRWGLYATLLDATKSVDGSLLRRYPAEKSRAC